MTAHIATTAKIYENVELGENVVIEDYCLIGVPFRNMDPESGRTVIGDNAVIRSHTVIYAGNVIGRNFQSGHKANIREQNTIGDDVSIGTLANIEHHVKIEDGVRIHSQAFVPEFSILRQNCWLGPNTVLTNCAYPCSPQAKECLQGPVIETEAKVGANVTVLPGRTIGRRALVGAGSVVAKDVEDEAVVAGNPAKKIKTIKELPYE